MKVQEFVLASELREVGFFPQMEGILCLQRQKGASEEDEI